MTAILIIVVGVICLVCGYVFYGSWLAKQWGVDPTRKTPAYEMEDGVDYVPAKPAVLMGHHYSSIAGAGPINGPVQAAVFGWVPVFLWCVIGGIFFGGVQDFGSLFASVRHKGKSVGEIIHDTMGKRAARLFSIFALLVLILVIASFVNVVAGTFASDNWGITTGTVTGNETTAMVSVLFIVLAIVYGLLTNRAGLSTNVATVIGIVCIIAFLFVGLNVGLALSRTTWIVLIGVYITIASLVPVWILLQPRDYLSSFLLYAMMATGTTSKQLSSEADAKPIGYGSMLIESALALIALIAVGMVFTKYTNGEFGSPAVAFSSGIALMFGAEESSVYNTVYALLTLAVSVFALTSLDTGTRLSRFMFTELFLKGGEASWRDATGIRKFLAYPLTGTLIMVVIGCVLGGLSLSQIWGLFGAANQLLAGLALLAVAAWLGNIGRNNKMFYIPMCFMLIATLTSLVMTVYNKIVLIGAGGAAWGDWFQLIFAAAMVVLAVILAIEGIQTLSSQAKAKKQKA